MTQVQRKKQSQVRVPFDDAEYPSPALPSALAGAAGGVLIGLLILVAIIGGYSIFIYFHGSDPLGVAVNLPTATPQPTSVPTRPQRVVVSTPAPTMEPTQEPTGEPTPLPTPVRMRLVPETIHVDAGSYSATGFTVEKEGAHVVGGFNSSSPVEFFIAESQYANALQSNESFPTVFFSGRITAAPQINVSLAQGSYLVGFNNRFSILTSKNIRAELFLEKAR